MQVRFLSAALYITLNYGKRLLQGAARGFFRFIERFGLMQKDKLTAIRDLILKHCKILFPLIVVVVVAVTVSVALSVRSKKNDVSVESGTAEESPSPESVSEEDGTQEIPLVPLVENEDPAVYSLVASYYNAMGTGDMETLRSTYDSITDNEVLWIQALSSYLDHYAAIQVNTKQGPVEGSVIAYIYYRVCFVNHEEEFPGYEMLYICTAEDGSLYIKNESNFTKDDIAYITAISSQDDVVEFNNRVDVEYNDLMREKPYLLKYLDEVGNQRDVEYGLLLANQNQGVDAPEGEESPEPNEGSLETPTPVSTPEPVPEYATATTTVNVRKSDSEKADKLGRVSSGTRLKVQEVLLNGWTKVVYEGADGYIKSEYLQFSESAAGQEAIGTVTAKTNINVRSGAGQDTERLGMLAGGESLDLLAVEGDWCKVNFGGQTGYVKSEYVTINQ